MAANRSIWSMAGRLFQPTTAGATEQAAGANRVRR